MQDISWIKMTQNRVQRWAFAKTVGNFCAS